MSGPWGGQENGEGGEANTDAQGGQKAWLEEGGERPKPQRTEKFDHSQHLKRPRRKTWVVTSQHLSASLGPSLAGPHTAATKASNRQPGQVLFLSS